MSIDLKVISENELVAEGVTYRCAIGSAGFIDGAAKCEGDKKTPIGRFHLRECWYRADRIERPTTQLIVKRIKEEDGWCDAPEHPEYNRHVSLPFDASHEKLWREDHAYDLIVPIGYNDFPIEAGKGSAIFLHVAQPDFRGTEGCVALAIEDLLALLPKLTPDSMIAIR